MDEILATNIRDYYLPEDLVLKEILPKLPVKSLFRFKCVSKTWLSYISDDSSLISTHLNHHSQFPYNIVRARNSDEKKVRLKLFLLGHENDKELIELDTSYMTQALRKISDHIYRFIGLVGSSNGLVCINVADSDGSRTLILWNPATREFNCLPQPNIPNGIFSPHWHHRSEWHCFGFDEESKDYKVVKIEEINPDFVNVNDPTSEEETLTLDIQVFSKKRGTWRQLEAPSGFEILATTWEGIVIDGAVHWALLRGEVPAKGSSFSVLSLDLRNEVFREADGPACHVDECCYTDFELIKWKGCLGAFMITRTDEKYEFEIWSKTMKIDYGNLGWIKMCVMNLSLPIWSVVGVLRDEFIIYDDDNHKMFLYDTTSQEKKEVDKEFGRVFFYNVYDYVPSLVSPNSNL